MGDSDTLPTNRGTWQCRITYVMYPRYLKLCLCACTYRSAHMLNVTISAIERKLLIKNKPHHKTQSEARPLANRPFIFIFVI